MELSPEQKEAIEQQKEHCPFCQIVKGEIPAKKVYEDEHIIAILDINPISKGHLLVMPKEHYPILPLIPPEEFEHLFRRVREISEHLREAMLAKHCSVFVANGQAAGQQSTHFLVHVIPSDEPLSHLQVPEKELPGDEYQEASQMLAHNLPIMMRERAQKYPMEDQPAPKQPAQPGGVSDLAVFIEENPQLKQLIIENPDAVIEGIEDNPSLKPLFEGVDVHELSERLKQAEDGELSVPPPTTPQQPPESAPAQQSPRPAPTKQPSTPAASKPSQEPPGQSEEVPRAKDLSDEQLAAFIDGNDTLRTLLLEDPDTLRIAIEQQPKLQRFFENTTPEDVRERYVGHKDGSDARPASGGGRW